MTVAFLVPYAAWHFPTTSLKKAEFWQFGSFSMPLLLGLLAYVGVCCSVCVCCCWSLWPSGTIALRMAYAPSYGLRALSHYRHLMRPLKASSSPRVGSPASRVASAWRATCCQASRVAAVTITAIRRGKESEQMT